MRIPLARSLPRRRDTLGILLAAALFASACHGGDPGEDPPGAGEIDPAAEEQTESDEPTEPEAEEESAAPVEAEPLVAEVDIEERNFEGMTFRVDRLEVDGDAIMADVEIVVPADLALLWQQCRGTGVRP